MNIGRDECRSRARVHRTPVQQHPKSAKHENQGDHHEFQTERRESARR